MSWNRYEDAGGVKCARSCAVSFLRDSFVNPYSNHYSAGTMNTSDGRERDSIDGRIERAKDKALGAHDSNPSHVDEAGEAAGGISGVLVGAGIGSAAGPLGTLIGGIAGAIGGWWAGRAVTEAASALTSEDDAHFRGHYEAHPERPHGRSYDDVRGAYYLGQIASYNPSFNARDWVEVEPELERGWTLQSDATAAWTTMRPYAAEGFSRGRSRLDDSAARARADDSGLTPGERNDRRP
jgi:outer membrane lipoprotein SlyB